MAKLRQKNGTFDLIKDNGQVCTCPYRSMITTQVVDNKAVKKLEELDKDNIKLIQTNQVCTSDCAKFQMKEDDKGNKKVLLSCGTGTVYEIDEVIQPDDKKVKALNHILR